MMNVLEAKLPEKTKCSVSVQGVTALATVENSVVTVASTCRLQPFECGPAVVRKMLYEVSSAFARDGSDIGCVPSLQMSINLRDNIPMQCAYSSVPKPLFKEVKDYIQDLLAKGWIVKSNSPYSAPVVCVRMEEMLDSIMDECCIPYLDDVLCYAMSFEEHVEGIHKVLRALQSHGAKLRLEKCELFDMLVTLYPPKVCESCDHCPSTNG